MMFVRAPFWIGSGSLAQMTVPFMGDVKKAMTILVLSIFSGHKIFGYPASN